jgi:putative membrane protein
MKQRLPVMLLVIYVIYFCILGINPYSRPVWFVENMAIVPIVLFLAFTYRKFQFSNASYIMMSFLIFMHTLGGHFTFERVPFAFVTNLFGFQRNHYDRIAHFTVGFYAFPIAEYIQRKKLSNSLVLTLLFGVFTICTVALLYELFEWGYAVSADPAAGIAVLGSQGDIWDAQKDMLADTLGAVVAATMFYLLHKRKTMDHGEPK